MAFTLVLLNMYLHILSYTVLFILFAEQVNWFSVPCESIFPRMHVINSKSGSKSCVKNQKELHMNMRLTVSEPGGV